MLFNKVSTSCYDHRTPNRIQISVVEFLRLLVYSVWYSKINIPREERERERERENTNNTVNVTKLSSKSIRII